MPGSKPAYFSENKLYKDSTYKILKPAIAVKNPWFGLTPFSETFVFNLNRIIFPLAK